MSKYYTVHRYKETKKACLCSVTVPQDIAEVIDCYTVRMWLPKRVVTDGVIEAAFIEGEFNKMRERLKGMLLRRIEMIPARHKLPDEVVDKMDDF